jgi:proteic killer suppression protein
MIKSFKHKGLEKFFNKGDTSKLNPAHVEKIGDILFIIDNAKVVEDTNFSGSDWHKLKGNRKNTYSVAVRANWKITFEFESGNAYILDYEDYH